MESKLADSIADHERGCAGLAMADRKELAVSEHVANPPWEVCMQKEHVLPDSQRIKLDVGGKHFATTLSTLSSTKGTFFESMFGGVSALSV